MGILHSKMHQPVPYAINLSGVSVIYTLLCALIFCRPVCAQEQPLNPVEIYRNAYITALEDGEIDDKEEALLRSIQTSLRLSGEDIEAVMASVQVDSGYVDQSGRWLVVGQNMVYGATIYGWMIPDILGAEDTKWYVGSEMISLAGSFYFTYHFTKGAPLSLSRAQMMRLGSLIGLRYGFGLSTLLKLEYDEGKSWKWIVMSSIPAGIYLGDRLYKHWTPSHGQSWTLGLGAGISAFTFAQLHSIFHPAPEEPSNESFESNEDWENSERYRSWERDEKRWNRTNTFIELAGYPIGIYLAHRFWKPKHISFGDALMLTQGAVTGSLHGMLIAVLMGVDFDKGEAWRLAPVVGSIAGTCMMDRIIAGYDYTVGQSIVSSLGTLSGAAFMSGIAVITETRNEKALSALLLTGGISGFLLTNKIFDLKKEKRASLSLRDRHLCILPVCYRDRGTGALLPAISLSAVF